MSVDQSDINIIDAADRTIDLLASYHFDNSDAGHALATALAMVAMMAAKPGRRDALIDELATLAKQYAGRLAAMEEASAASHRNAEGHENVVPMFGRGRA